MTLREITTAAAIRSGTVAIAALILLGSSACNGRDDGERDSTPGTVVASTAPSSQLSTSGLYVIGSDGSGLRRIAGGDGYLYFGPAWSPDGTAIVVTRFQTGAAGQLVLVDPEDLSMQPLNANGVPGYLPAWSRDGTRIAFVSQSGEDTETADIHAITVEGTDELSLTDDDTQDYGVTWSLKGDFVFVGSERAGSWEIVQIDVETRVVQQLATTAEGNAPALSPDGRQIAFTSDRDGDDDIYLMEADGSTQRNLTMNSDHDDNAAWSPDGTRIAFSSDRTGKNEIYVLDLATGETTQITTGVILPDIPSWSADGTMIAFGALQPTQ